MNSRQFDHVVIGSGLAGLWFALQAARTGASVGVICKGRLRETATSRAQGGIAAAVGPDDDPAGHYQDTLAAGAGLCDPEVVRLVVSEGPARVRELEEVGVPFARDEAGRLELGREGGHGMRRILHVGDTTGRAVQCALVRAVRANDHITLLEHHTAVDLLTATPPGMPGVNGCHGVRVLDPAGRSLDLLAPVTVLATGGLGRIYATTSNPPGATGDGVAMAWRAGVTVRNLEFVQFHPTCMTLRDGTTTLLTEALRGEGGVLRNADGESFMDAVHPLGSLAPRDVVARAIEAEEARTGEPVVLDLTGIDEHLLVNRFTGLHRLCVSMGIDIRLDPLPVRPAAHYACGGVRTGHYGETDLPGLYAVGEVACTGLHGANRLASNSLLEAVVFAHRAASHAAGRIGLPAPGRVFPDVWPSLTSDAAVLAHVRHTVPRVMDDLVAVVRNRSRLRLARHQLQTLEDAVRDAGHIPGADPDAPTARQVEALNMVTVAGLVIESALHRGESRGTHFLDDLPAPDNTRPVRPTDIVHPAVDRRTEYEPTLARASGDRSWN